MHPQKRDLVIATQRHTAATGEQLECECGRPVVPFSCYCAECEADIVAQEVAEAEEAAYVEFKES